MEGPGSSRMTPNGPRHSSNEGNFVELLKLITKHNESFEKYFSMEMRNKYMGWSSQNEILELLSHTVLRGIVEKVRSARFFGSICDEVCDLAMVEQLSVCVRFCDDDFNVHESWLCFAQLDNASAETITATIKQAVLSVGLDINDARAQSYDRASTMRGSRTGVATRILRDYPKCTFSYCSGHGLSLVLQDCVASHVYFVEAQELVRRVVQFVRYSPRRKVSFSVFLAYPDEGPNVSLRPLCPTRWTLRAGALSAFLSMYAAIIDWPPKGSRRLRAPLISRIQKYKNIF